MIPIKVVHHYSGTYIGQVVTYKMVDAWHKAAGSTGFGYHGMVPEDGDFIPGRALTQRGAHCRGGWNENTLGLMYVGGLRKETGGNKGVDTRTEAQKKTLLEVTQEWCKRFPTITDVCGHRDLVATQCPGYDVRAWWAEANDIGQVQPSAPVPKDARVVTNPLVMKGHRGASVKLAQELLTSRGFSPGPIDSLFGKDTDAAVRRFQTARRIPSDGKVGPVTWAELFKP